ncbi:hypothetical protein [Cohnella sp.]|uniref:hypothetical protein n=1 Tax=Cohnella sp. TaxID=1883426 RepID=UPI00356A7583
MDPFNLEDREPYTTRESILEMFDAVDADLQGQKTIEVFVVGYSAIVLARKNNRGSNDVDMIPSRFSRVFARHGLEVFDDAHDIWFSKLAAYHLSIAACGRAL